MEIKVLGPGCVKCRGLAHRVEKAVASLQLSALFEKVDDLNEIMRFGVLQTPALVVDGEVVIRGDLPSYKAICKLLEDLKNKE
ncbi:thioredoxin family protein [Sunxiuqinia elliptica]|uniref:Small redox-active disulfide protein 2 n=1 Tax=Sunxiuqinia elliptica TaxID=655355 RepID=A0A4R6H9X0_9BACT|nr:thioredoxin family protein [Sunxiuqinia elliptica]TDO04698.1 small redox-active disulfide protein 2 [Sunxiuqinia elliptica]TDO64246.1 small redox-active disulfide protein 2 [Sunxiuqinia elliptica]